MLETKGLYRVYKPKKGTEVVALNHISIKFPDKGLVFILGKSGSGKSTLLNVMGGLDKADSGEIIIKGKSSKDFKQKDFDSYRNTYLGFIFQEYNILDEFNVGQNIALAIELQGRKATSEEINNILKEVDLDGYGNRKPNELSGGQKQRVAIARALVKNPEIIFADEPTGALDSKTGMAVFDTLKKLSKDKLVIVVSHDREFAELYGDRVIELADGIVISDIEKIKVKGESKSKGLTLIDGKVLKINEGYELTKEDFEVVKEYLNKSKGERLISLDGKINENVRHIARIDEFGDKDSFKKTDENAIKNDKGEFHSIKSRLSLKNCFKIGASSLKVKPFRLVMTIILSLVAFGMFGLSDTMGSYNKIDATVNSIYDNKIADLALENNIIKDSGNSSYSSNEEIYNEDIPKLKEKYGLDFSGVQYISDYRQSNSINSMISNVDQNPFYPKETPGLFVVNEEKQKEQNFTLLSGTYPKNLGEVCITKHLLDSFAFYGYTESNNKYIEPSNITNESLLGKKIEINDTPTSRFYTISGVIDTHFDTSNYKTLDNTRLEDLGSYLLMSQYNADCRYSSHDLLFTNQETFDDLRKDLEGKIDINIQISNGNLTTQASSIYKYDPNDESVVLKTGVTGLGDYDTIASGNTIYQIIKNNNGLDTHIKETQITLGKDTYVIKDIATLSHFLCATIVSDGKYESYYTKGYAYDYIDEAIKKGFDPESFYREINGEDFDGVMSNDKKVEMYSNFLGFAIMRENDFNQYADSKKFDDYFYEKGKTILGPNIDTLLSLLTPYQVDIYPQDYYGNVQSLSPITAKGIKLDLTPYLFNYFYLSDNTIKKYIKFERGYSFLLTPMPQDRNLLKRIVIDNYNYDLPDGSQVYSLVNALTPIFSSINPFIEMFANVFLYIGIGFAVFASLMLFNFITISINYKKREIGILRAVGARSTDVFNIFFAESFIITMISYCLAMIAVFICSYFINASLRSGINLSITLLAPGIRQIGLVLGVCILVALISTFLPVYKIAMKRPIDAIKNR